MIEVKNLVKNYGKYEAVKGISFKVDTGEVVGFLGPNGAGKIYNNEYNNRLHISQQR